MLYLFIESIIIEVVRETCKALEQSESQIEHYYQ